MRNRNGGSLRIAFFPDAYNEVDGVANTSRHFEAFAENRQLPFLTVHAGPRKQSRSPVRAIWGCSVRLLRIDLVFRSPPVGRQICINMLGVVSLRCCPCFRSLYPPDC